MMTGSGRVYSKNCLAQLSHFRMTEIQVSRFRGNIYDETKRTGKNLADYGHQANFRINDFRLFVSCTCYYFGIF